MDCSDTEYLYNSECVLQWDLVSKYSYELYELCRLCTRWLGTDAGKQFILFAQQLNALIPGSTTKTEHSCVCNLFIVYLQLRLPMHTFVEATAAPLPKRSLQRPPDRAGSRMRPPFHQTFRSRYQRRSTGSRSAPTFPEQLRVIFRSHSTLAIGGFLICHSTHDRTHGCHDYHDPERHHLYIPLKNISWT